MLGRSAGGDVQRTSVFARAFFGSEWAWYDLGRAVMLQSGITTTQRGLSLTAGQLLLALVIVLD